VLINHHRKEKQIAKIDGIEQKALQQLVEPLVINLLEIDTS